VTRRRLAVAIVGAGGLAAEFGRALARSRRAAVTVASRRPSAAARLARGVRGLTSVRRIEDAVAGADVILVAVPDRAVAGVARALAAMRPSWRGAVVLHAAGAYGPELLRALAARGASTGVLHPLAVLAGTRGDALAGASARIEGDVSARRMARRLCALVGSVPIGGSGLQTPRGRAAYHAAASLASNDLVALLAAARGLLVRHGVRGRQALAAVVRLADGALRSVRDVGVSRALTGPVVRDDAATLAKQLRALARDDGDAARAHRALSLRLVEVAAASGRLDPAAARRLRRMLGRGPGAGRTV
jgi:predicted short-subunit dehydrogenase-like oxidoreductase (DUF2520 family)